MIAGLSSGLPSPFPSRLCDLASTATHAYMQAMVKSFETADVPARCAKFIARKQWVATGSDDMIIRVYNYNTMEREKMFEAHSDYIRSIAVHPTLPYLLSCSDDMFIKLWDWDKGWKCVQVFEGHVHYVMQVRGICK
jgi:coatomer subunit beta'